MKEYYVYEWFLKKSKKVFYVGKGKAKRYKAYGHRSYRFNYMISHYDCDVRIVKDNLSEDEAFVEEVRRISFYRSQPDCILVNITNGGEGASGYICSQDTKDHLSKVMKRIWRNDDHFRNRMIAIRQDPNGPYKSEEFRKKISKIVSGENNPNYGNTWAPEMKKSLADKQKK